MHWLRRIIEGVFSALYTLPDGLALWIISALCGVVALWVVGLVLPPDRLTHARDRMIAALYEIRLYFDSPWRVLTSQARVLGWSLAYTGWMGLPMLVLAIPFGLMFLHLEVRHGLEPLPTKAPILVTMDVAEGCDGDELTLEVPEGVKIDTPPLYDDRAHRAYQSVIINAPGTYEITVTGCGAELSKRLDADPAMEVVSPSRVKSLALLWAMTDEAPLEGDAPVDAISVDHPAADQRWMWLAMPWWAYWLIWTTVVAVALQKPMRVKL